MSNSDDNTVNGKREEIDGKKMNNQSESPCRTHPPTSDSGEPDLSAGGDGQGSNQIRGLDSSERDSSSIKSSGEGESSTSVQGRNSTDSPLQPESKRETSEAKMDDQKAAPDSKAAAKKDRSKLRKGKWTVRTKAIERNVSSLYLTSFSPFLCVLG